MSSSSKRSSFLMAIKCVYKIAKKNVQQNWNQFFFKNALLYLDLYMNCKISITKTNNIVSFCTSSVSSALTVIY